MDCQLWQRRSLRLCIWSPSLQFFVTRMLNLCLPPIAWRAKSSGFTVVDHRVPSCRLVIHTANDPYATRRDPTTYFTSQSSVFDFWENHLCCGWGEIRKEPINVKPGSNILCLLAPSRKMSSWWHVISTRGKIPLILGDSLEIIVRNVMLNILGWVTYSSEVAFFE